MSGSQRAGNLKEGLEQLQQLTGGRKGFVLPVVVFGLMLMSTLAVVAVLTAGDEQRSSRAMHESSQAFYAAEAGLQMTYAMVDSFQAALTASRRRWTRCSRETAWILVG
jgi:Tfp pilus assembly protein PilX